jgi:hypothetical protein
MLSFYVNHSSSWSWLYLCSKFCHERIPDQPYSLPEALTLFQFREMTLSNTNQFHPNQHIMQIILQFLALDDKSMESIYGMNYFGRCQFNLYYENQFNVYHKDFQFYLSDPNHNPEPELKLPGLPGQNRYKISQALLSSNI